MVFKGRTLTGSRDAINDVHEITVVFGIRMTAIRDPDESGNFQGETEGLFLSPLQSPGICTLDKLAFGI